MDEKLNARSTDSNHQKACSGLKILKILSNPCLSTAEKYSPIRSKMLGQVTTSCATGTLPITCFSYVKPVDGSDLSEFELLGELHFLQHLSVSVFTSNTQLLTQRDLPDRHELFP